MYQEGYSPTAYDNFVLYEKLFVDDGRACVTLVDGKQIYDDAYYFHFYRWAIAPTWVDRELTPHMIFGAKGYIPQLENKKYDNRTINHLNKYGLNIYLYEVLTFARELLPRPNFKIDKNSNLLETIIDSYGSSMVLECLDTEYDSLQCYELESINTFAKNNNLTNVNVYTCHYNIKFIQDKYPHINLFCKDLHLASMVDYPEEAVYPFQQVEPSELIETKFISPNWRYHSTRHLVMSYLADKPGIYSWYYKGTIDTLKKNVWFDLDQSPVYEKIKQGAELLNTLAPLEINQTQTVSKIDGKVDYLKYPGGIKGSPGDYRMDDAYLKSFCAVVTESFFAMPTGIVSEKVLNAIKLGRPFVIVAPPNTLEYMHKLGFQTFERYWDESYDSEPNHERRLSKIFEVLDYINSMSIDELKVWYANMKDTLEHNAEVVKTLKVSGNIL